MQDKKIYCDANATTHLFEVIEKRMQQDLPKIPLNPSSTHAFGQIARDVLQSSRERVLSATMLNSIDSYDLIFTSSGTESNNTIMNSFDKNAICISQIEHPSILNTNPKFIANVDKNGLVDMENLEKILRENKIQLVSVMQANNESGVIQNIDEICKLAKKYNAFFHTDASQSFSKINCNFDKIQPDFITISSHKIYGPIGVSAIIFKKTAPIKKFLFGGSQEFERRAGTENIPAIYGFSLACEMSDYFVKEYEKIKQIRDKIDEIATKKGYEIASKNATRLPNTTMIFKPNANTSEELLKLDFNGILASGGSACSWGMQKSSQMPKILGLDEKFHNCTIRFSFGVEMNDIFESLFNALKQIL